MTISTIGERIAYQGDGSTLIFSFPFPFLETSDLIVILKNTTTGVETTLVEDTDYTATLLDDDSGGSVTLFVAPPLGSTLTIYRDVPATQETHLQENDPLPVSELEASLDRLTLIVQGLQDQVSRSVSLTQGFSALFNPQLPALLPAGNAIVVNPQGSGFDVADLATVSIQAALNAFFDSQSAIRFNVVDNFGLVGDGVTDNTSKLNAAIASLTSGSELYFPPGVYGISGVITVNVSNIRLYGNPGFSILRALAGNNNQLQIINVTGQSFVTLDGLTLDANQANRTNQANTWNGLNLTSTCSDCNILNCVFENTLGFNGSATACGIGGNRIRVSGCTVKNAGIAGTNASDAFYNSGTQILVENCIALNASDTGFVLEQCSFSGIVGCTVDGCGSGVGIDAYQNANAVGNFINGLSIYNWSGTVGAALLVGTVAAGTGNLLNTVISNVTIQNVSGEDCGIEVCQGTGTGICQYLTISNCVVNMGSAGSQAFLVLKNAKNISVIGCIFTSLNASNTTCVQLTGSGQTNDISFIGNQIVTNNTFAIQFGGASSTNAIIKDNIIDGQSTASYGIFCSSSATAINTEGNQFIGSWTQTTIGGDSTTSPRDASKIVFAAAIPSASNLGLWVAGTVVLNSAVTATSTMGWVCTTGGVAGGAAVFTALPPAGVGVETSAAQLTPTNAAATTTFANICSVSIPAGKWVVYGVSNWQLNSATVTAVRTAITTSNGNAGTEGQSMVTGAPPTSNYSMTQTVPPVYFSFGTATTVYLTGAAIFSGGTPQYIGSFVAIRVG